MGWRNGRARPNRRKRSRKEQAKEFLSTATARIAAFVPRFLTVLLIASVPAGVYLGWKYIQTMSVLNIDQVDIQGNGRTDRKDVLQAIGYHGPNTHILELDLRECEASLRALPWVREAHVERVLPSRVNVHLTERSAHGLVLLADGLYLADDTGVPFKPIERELAVDQPVVTGNFGVGPATLNSEDHAQIQDAFALMKLYSRYGLDAYDRLSEVYVDPFTGYSLVTERYGVRVLLGEGSMELRLGRLKQVFRELEHRNIVARTVRLDAERLRDRVTIELESPGKGAP